MGAPRAARAVGWLAALALPPVLLLVALSFLADRLIFYPEPGAQIRPAEVGFPEGEDVYLRTEDGVRIHAFWLPAPAPETDGGNASAGEAAADPRRALLFLHGNAGNASHRLPNAAELARLGIHVLLLEYRGYGLSEGSPSEEGVYADARAGLAHLVEERGIPEERIVVFGRSLGGAVAVDLAESRELAGLILESTFSSAADVARSMLGPLAAFAGDRFDSAAKIGEVRCPLLFFHGDRDGIVPFELGRRLFDAAPQPKAFETIVGAGHNDTVEVAGRPYFDRIRRFLDEVAPVGEYKTAAPQR